MAPHHRARSTLKKRTRHNIPGNTRLQKRSKNEPLAIHTVKISSRGEERTLPATIASIKRAIRTARREGREEIGRQSGEGFPQPVIVCVFAGNKEVFKEKLTVAPRE